MITLILIVLKRDPFESDQWPRLAQGLLLVTLTALAWLLFSILKRLELHLIANPWQSMIFVALATVIGMISLMLAQCARATAPGWIRALRLTYGIVLCATIVGLTGFHGTLQHYAFEIHASGIKTPISLQSAQLFQSDKPVLGVIPIYNSTLIIPNATWNDKGVKWDRIRVDTSDSEYEPGWIDHYDLNPYSDGADSRHATHEIILTRKKTTEMGQVNDR